MKCRRSQARNQTRSQVRNPFWTNSLRQTENATIPTIIRSCPQNFGNCPLELRGRWNLEVVVKPAPRFDFGFCYRAEYPTHWLRSGVHVAGQPFIVHCPASSSSTEDPGTHPDCNPSYYRRDSETDDFADTYRPGCPAESLILYNVVEMANLLYPQLWKRLAYVLLPPPAPFQRVLPEFFRSHMAAILRRTLESGRLRVFHTVAKEIGPPGDAGDVLYGPLPLDNAERTVPFQSVLLGCDL
ncbi:hypothetical protein FB45DRAFT_1001518 [Roridomyces roridus]|uniref:Uncharacterized protein n=1 Tax=Roridomyces roridus TaxID=1738132 RepID=A0AAD7FSW1_9AGAR|nr:hypothetical protein FB45DRAFT_1001518 [Roridomyces roridus]